MTNLIVKTVLPQRGWS